MNRDERELELALGREEERRSTAERTFMRRLDPLLAWAARHQNVTDLFVNDDRIELRHGSGTEFRGFASFPGFGPTDVRAACANVAVLGNKEFGPPPATPRLSVVVPPDLRVTATRPPLAESWNLAVRFLRARGLSLGDYVAAGTMTERQAGELRRLVTERKNVIVSGGTGAGKTTLMRAMLREVPAGTRLVVLEDTAELSLPGAYHLRTCEGTTLAQLLAHALREQPDRIVVGEVRGPEALELVRAMNTGHDGTLATLHSNGAREALWRLHTLVAEAQPSFPFAGILGAVDVVLQLEAMGEERRLADIWHVPRGDGRELGR